MRRSSRRSCPSSNFFQHHRTGKYPEGWYISREQHLKQLRWGQDPRKRYSQVGCQGSRAFRALFSRNANPPQKSLLYIFGHADVWIYLTFHFITSHYQSPGFLGTENPSGFWVLRNREPALI